MKKKYALIVNPDTSSEEIVKWTGKYDIVIRPGQDLDKKTTILSQSIEIVQKIDCATCFDCLAEPDEGDLPTKVYSFVFNAYREVTLFLAEQRLIIGYDHINDISR